MTRKKSTKTVPSRPRNPLHDHPLMNKGAPHGKTQKAIRRRDKVQQRGEWDYPSRAAA